MMRLRLPVLLLLCCLLHSQLLLLHAKANTAAVPRSKAHKKGLSSILGGGFVRNLMREAKISFCSELEGLTLQVTKPNPAAIPLNLLEELTNFVDLEHDNPELIIGILVKLSRKFSEKNVFTQVKALLTIHAVMQQIEDKAKTNWSKAIKSMRDEEDQKVQMNFFSLDAIEEASSSTGTVLELQTLEFNRLYAQYLFDYLVVRGDKASSKHALDPSDKAEMIVELLQQGEELENLCNQMETGISQQCIHSITTDRSWYVKTLTKMYEANTFDNNKELEISVEKTLSKWDSKFKPAQRPMIEMTGQEDDDMDAEHKEDDNNDDDKMEQGKENESELSEDDEDDMNTRTHEESKSDEDDEEHDDDIANDDDEAGSDIPPVLRNAVKNSINKPSTIEHKQQRKSKKSTKASKKSQSTSGKKSGSKKSKNVK